MTIQHKAYDGTTIAVNIEGVGELSGIESVEFGLAQEFVRVKGVGQKAIGFTPGIKTPEDGSMEIWLSEFERWKAAAGGFDQMLDNSFDVTITYDNEALPFIETKLVGCRITSTSSSHSTSTTDNLVVTVNFSILDIE
jgi:hypothetical protein